MSLDQDYGVKQYGWINQIFFLNRHLNTCHEDTGSTKLDTVVYLLYIVQLGADKSWRK